MKLVGVFTTLLISVFAADSSQEDPAVGQKVVLEIDQNGAPLGNLTLGLFTETVPKTVENFYLLAKTKKYKNTLFHRVIKDFMIQGGDIDGKGGYSIYGKKRGDFPDENFVVKHDKIGRLAMANAGPNTAMSQFYITTGATKWLDGNYVVFGQLLDGFDTLKFIEAAKTDRSDKPLEDVRIREVYTYDADGNLDTKLTEEEKSYGIQSDGDDNSKEETPLPPGDKGGDVEDDKGNDKDAHDGYEKQREKVRNKYSAYYVLLPLVIFGGLLVFITIKARNNILYAIRGPRYRRIQVHR
ncbi:DEKNAAC104665 [Brettanomyces naardenensis]|uniref:Peptidyl-prolyl cis-trans isomerase n=1 Tax=Brettanomyces naardenensis TaxID=13370 RepID=A0A448YRJ1_BRENA|nr:DEKNAAC104665 [Brettanomyces naardenensis]